MSIVGYKKEESGQIRSVRKCPKCGEKLEVEATKGSFRRRKCGSCGERYVTREMFREEYEAIEQLGKLGSSMLILLSNLFGITQHPAATEEKAD